jgi:hypothetical protein
MLVKTKIRVQEQDARPSQALRPPVSPHRLPPLEHSAPQPPHVRWAADLEETQEAVEPAPQPKAEARLQLLHAEPEALSHMTASRAPLSPTSREVAAAAWRQSVVKELWRHRAQCRSTSLTSSAGDGRSSCFPFPLRKPRPTPAPLPLSALTLVAASAVEDKPEPGRAQSSSRGSVEERFVTVVCPAGVAPGQKIAVSCLCDGATRSVTVAMPPGLRQGDRFQVPEPPREGRREDAAVSRRARQQR